MPISNQHNSQVHYMRTYTCKYLLDCGSYTKGTLVLKWPDQGSFNIPKLMCLCVCVCACVCVCVARESQP